MGRYFKKKIKKTRSPFPTKIVLITLGIFLAIGIIIGIVFLIKNAMKPVYEIKKDITLQQNFELPEKKELFDVYKNMKDDYVTVNYDNVDNKTLGVYNILVTVNVDGQKNEYVVVASVIDSILPMADIKPLTINEGETYALENFYTSCVDNSAYCDVQFVDEKYANITELGTHEIQIVLTDGNGNQSVVDTTLTIKSETVIPVDTKWTTFVDNFKAYEGEMNKTFGKVDIISDNSSIIVKIYQDNDVIHTFNLTYDNNVITYSKNYDSVLDIYNNLLVDIVIESYAKVFGYNPDKLALYLPNLKNTTIQEYGVEYSLIKVSDGNGGSLNYVNLLKLDLQNGLKKYTENDEPDPPVDPKPKCTYGSMTPGNSNSIIAYDISKDNDGCPIDRNLTLNHAEQLPKKYIEKIEAIFNADLDKLQKQTTFMVSAENIKINATAITNKDGIGVVGYSIEVLLYVDETFKIKDSTTLQQDQYLKERYFIKEDGSRVYSVNAYNLN